MWKQGLNLEQLSALLWGRSGGNAKTRGGTSNGKTPGPFSQRFYVPLSLQVYVRHVRGLIPGVYSYNGASHSLSFLDEGERSGRFFAAAAIGEQPWLADAAAVIVVAGGYPEYASRHSRSRPPVAGAVSATCIWKTGAVSQNIHLQATALGLGK